MTAGTTMAARTKVTAGTKRRPRIKVTAGTKTKAKDQNGSKGHGDSKCLQRYWQEQRHESRATPITRATTSKNRDMVMRRVDCLDSKLGLDAI
ncbi:MAG: hypothetical protein JWQ42_1087 [Edaphobacter sp.]|nr:hypothetical protein [Edaphobacter sp.]